MLDYLDQQWERVEIAHAFYGLVATQQEPIDDWPLNDLAAEPCYQPELDEHHVACLAPPVNFPVQVRQQTQNPSELPLGRPQAVPRR